MYHWTGKICKNSFYSCLWSIGRVGSNTIVLQSIAILWYWKISKYCNTYCKSQNIAIFIAKHFQVLQKVLQYFQCITKSIAKSIAKSFKYCKKYCYILRTGIFLSCAFLYYNLIGNIYVYIIFISFIYLHFFVIDSLWWIKLFLYVIYWIQNLCLLYNLFDEYNYTLLKYYLQTLIDDCMMWCFYCSMLCSILWYGVVWNSIVLCSVLFGNTGCYIVVECIQSVF